MKVYTHLEVNKKIKLTGREHFYYIKWNELYIKQQTVGLNPSLPSAEDLVCSAFLFSITVIHQIYSINAVLLKLLNIHKGKMLLITNYFNC